LIQKESFLIPSDKTGVFYVKTFHLYYGFSRKSSRVGFFVKVSVRSRKPDSILRKKKKLKSLFTCSRYFSKKLDGSLFLYYENNVVLIKKKIIF
jgi:ribosomal protein L14